MTPLPTWKPDEILMLPAPAPVLALPAITAPADVVGAHPSRDGFKAVVIGTTATGIRIEHTAQVQTWGSPRQTTSEIPYAQMHLYKFTPRTRAYLAPNHNQEPPRQPITPTEPARGRFAQAMDERQAHALAEMARLKAERTMPEITGDAIEKVQRQQAAVTKRHNAAKYEIVAQAPSGTMVKRWTAGGKMP